MGREKVNRQMTIRSSALYGVVLAAWLAFGIVLAHAFMATSEPSSGCTTLPRDILDQIEGVKP